MAFPVTGILDPFTRADTGPPPSGSWTTSTGTGHKVVSNTCAPDTGGSGSVWSAAQFAATQEVYATISTMVPAGQTFTLVVRQVTAANYLSNHYEIACVPAAGNGVIQVWKRVGGVWTQLGADINTGADWANGDVFGLRAVGNVLEVYRNGTLLATRTDTDISGGGYIGLWNGEVTCRWDNFGGGSLASRIVPGDIVGGHLVGGTMAT